MRLLLGRWRTLLSWRTNQVNDCKRENEMDLMHIQIRHTKKIYLSLFLFSFPFFKVAEQNVKLYRPHIKDKFMEGFKVELISKT